MGETKPEVYLLSFGDRLPDPRTKGVTSETDRVRGLVDQAVVAEESGFTGMAIGEHHFSGFAVSAPELVLAAIAAKTTRLRLTTAVTLLAYHDPVLVAERLATLDILSAGRAELIVAVGVSPEADEVFGVPPNELRPKFAEHLDLLIRLLNETNVTWQGNFRLSFKELTTVPRPVQTPRPVLWMGSGSETSANLAAELGMSLMLRSSLRDPRVFQPVVEQYRDKAAKPCRVGLPSHVFVADDSNEARQRWRPHLTAYAEFAEPWRGDGNPLNIDRLMDGAAICGDPVEVADRLNALKDLLGLDTHLVLMDIGGLPLPEVLDTIRLFGSQVIPKLR